MSQLGQAPSGRDHPLDAFRGLAIVMMVGANFLADKTAIPPWLKHAPDLGITAIDLIAPFFVVAMALAHQYVRSERRKDRGKGATSWPGLRRGFSLIGIGAILSAGQSLALPEGGIVDWGVLQSLGIVELALYASEHLQPLVQLGVVCALLMLYQLILPLSLPFILGRSHGGLLGAVAWAGMGLLASALVSLSRKEGRQFLPLAAFLCIIGGLAAARWAPLSKNRVSASYVIFCTGISLAVFAAIRFLYRWRCPRFSKIELWGRHALLLYLAHQLLLALFVLPPWPWWHADSPLWLIGIQALVLYCLLDLFVDFCEWRNLALRL